MEKNMLAGMEEMLSENKTTKSNEWIKVEVDAAKAEQIEQELGEPIDPDTLSIIDDLNPEDIIDSETAAILDNINLEDIIDPETIEVPGNINPEDIIDPETAEILDNIDLEDIIDPDDIVVPNNIDPKDIISSDDIILPESTENFPTIQIIPEQSPKSPEKPNEDF